MRFSACLIWEKEEVKYSFSAVVSPNLVGGSVRSHHVFYIKKKKRGSETSWKGTVYMTDLNASIEINFKAIMRLYS